MRYALLDLHVEKPIDNGVHDLIGILDINGDRHPRSIRVFTESDLKRRVGEVGEDE